MSVRVTHDVLVPGWIMTFGLVAIVAPPLSVAASLSLFLVGVLGIPAFILIPRLGGPLAFARMTVHTRNMRATCRVSVRRIFRRSRGASQVS